MGKMTIDLFFLNAQHLGQISGTTYFLGQQRYHLLANGLHSTFPQYLTSPPVHRTFVEAGSRPFDDSILVVFAKSS